MTILFLIGRILLGGYFLKGGINHLVRLNSMAGYAGSKGVPAPKLAVAGSGILLILGGLGILAGCYVQWAVLCIALFLVPVTFTIHRYWKETDEGMKALQKVNFEKNLALLGATLMLLVIPLPWIYSVSFGY